jgi:hypothetical protein
MFPVLEQQEPALERPVLALAQLELVLKRQEPALEQLEQVLAWNTVLDRMDNLRLDQARVL